MTPELAGNQHAGCLGQIPLHIWALVSSFVKTSSWTGWSVYLFEYWNPMILCFYLSHSSINTVSFNRKQILSLKIAKHLFCLSSLICISKLSNPQYTKLFYVITMPHLCFVKSQCLRKIKNSEYFILYKVNSLITNDYSILFCCD